MDDLTNDFWEITQKRLAIEYESGYISGHDIGLKTGFMYGAASMFIGVLICLAIAVRLRRR